MRLDTTILQSNTTIALVKYITRQQKIITKYKDIGLIPEKEYDKMRCDYETILNEHTKALHRRCGMSRYDKEYDDEQPSINDD